MKSRMPSGESLHRHGKSGEIGRAALYRQEQVGDQQGHRAGFQQCEHEKHGPARVCRSPVGHDHHGAAETHDLIGDEERHAVLQAGDAVGAEQAHRRAETPAAWRYRAGPGHKDQHGGGKAEAKQPGRVGIEPEMRAFHIRPKWQGERQGRGGECSAAKDHPGECAADQRAPALALPRAVQVTARAPGRKAPGPGGPDLSRHNGPPFTRCRLRASSSMNASIIAAGLGGQPGR